MLSLSAVVLNWNRAPLLDRCLSSFFATVEGFDKCIVIDNNSSDHSRDVIAKWADLESGLVPRLYPSNRGAEWINEAIEEIASDLVFIIANDKELLPGWQSYATKAFLAFHELGQLALHAPAPLDDEVWVTKPARYSYRDGVGLYLAEANTGMSSILRRTALKEARATFGNIDNGGTVRLPADGDLSNSLAGAGYRSAWSDRYYCLNSGHTLNEFRRDPGYYNANYGSKPWLGRAGLEARLADHALRPRPRRTSRVFGWQGSPESESGLLGEDARFWTSIDAGAPALETIEFIYGLVRLTKPSRAVVARGRRGHMLRAAASALRDNDRGDAWCIEPDPHLRKEAIQMLTDPLLSRRVEITAGGLPPSAADILILTGHCEPEEADSFVELASSIVASCVVWERGTFPLAAQKRLETLFAAAGLQRIDFQTPHGLAILRRPN